MGQQQLLILILVFVIVAIATYLAIDVFRSASDASSIDSIKSHLTSIAASAQSYYFKPAMIGGGGNSFEGIDFTKFAFSSTVEEREEERAENENGTYTISGALENEFIVTGSLGWRSAGNHGCSTHLLRHLQAGHCWVRRQCNRTSRLYRS